MLFAMAQTKGACLGHGKSQGSSLQELGLRRALALGKLGTVLEGSWGL